MKYPNGKEVSDDSVTFIYALKDPRDGSIRYIGKSDDPEKRLASHCAVGGRSLGRKRVKWLLELKEKGLKPVLEVLEETTVGEFRRRESYWIYYFSSRGERLTNSHANLITGAAGVTIRQDQRRRIKQMAKGQGVNYSTAVRALLDYALDNPPDDLLVFAMRNLAGKDK